MNVQEMNRVRDELKCLIEKQNETRRAQIFGGLSQKEWHEFERQRERIHNLTVLLLSVTATARRAA